MAVMYALADFTTGDLYEMALPLESVECGQSIDAGEFRARLDMRRVLDLPRDDWVAQAKDFQDILRAGTVSIIGIEDGVLLGEWWLVDVRRTHTDPVITLEGCEPEEYLRRLPIRTSRKSKGTDPVALARALVQEMAAAGRTLNTAVGTGGSTTGLSVPIEVQAGTVNYGDLLDDLTGNATFEWRIESSLVTSGGIPVRVARALRIGEPVLRTDRVDEVLEAVTPGVPPRGLLEYTEDDPVSARASEVWGFGGGSGKDQPKYVYDRPLLERMPRLGVTLQDPNAVTHAELNRAGWKALGAMHPDKRPFELVVSLDYVKGHPRVGDAFTMIRRPSYSVPVAEQRAVRVLEWKRKPAAPGRLVTLTVRREW